ncbi:hypothetical protein CSA37_09400 [Candidatus Fermentibacteria bacterium]|nr:MAG: hypothetical protein CSA37_09400 [Candidatus Fermentibacteria bacterium]
MRSVINWSLIRIFGLIVLGFIIAGFLVPDDAKTDDGFPLGYFFRGMASMFLFSTGGVLLRATL